MQTQFVHACGQRDVVSERAFAPALVDARFARAQDRMIRRFEDVTTLEVTVGLPHFAVAVGVVGAQMTGQDPLGLSDATGALAELADLAELEDGLRQDYPGARPNFRKAFASSASPSIT